MENRIAFYVSSETHIHHLEKIWRHVKPENRTILLCEKSQNRQEIERYLASEQTPFLLFSDAVGKQYYFSILVAMMNHAELVESPRLARRYARCVVHGLDGCTTTVDPFFDTFLCQGPYQAERLHAAYPDAAILRGGYARMDDYRPLPSASGRARILYVPTHAVSSLGAFYQELCELKDRYDITVKPHPDCWKKPEERACLEYFIQQGVRVIQEHTQGEDFLNGVDLFLADYGGSTLLGLYTGKPTVLLGTEMPYMERRAPMEITLRGELPYIAPEHKDTLAAVIEKELHEKRDMTELRRRYFYDHEEPAGLLFARGLQELLVAAAV